MEDLLSKLPENEIEFLMENESLTKNFYYQLCEIKHRKNEQVILYDNSYQRRIVHILAHVLRLYHARHGEWNDEYKEYFDHQCQCKYCWKGAGEKYYRIVGIKVSTNPIKLSNKDRIHQKHNNLLQVNK